MTEQADVRAPAVAQTGCCPPFDPAPWQDQEITWSGKQFLRDHVACLFHVPLNMGQTVAKDMARIHAAHADTDGQPLMLSDDRSPWGTDIFIEVKRAVPEATMEEFSGTFFTRVFEGPFRQAGEWARQMQDYVAAKGRTLEKLYFGYTTCPKCAKAYGKNYVVLFARVSAQAARSSAA
jgi:hydrolase family protein